MTSRIISVAAAIAVCFGFVTLSFAYDSEWPPAPDPQTANIPPAPGLEMGRVEINVPTVFAEWLKVSRAGEHDAVLVFSVGGGDVARNVSPNIVRALDEARSRGVAIFGIVGRDGGYTRKVGDEVIVVPTVDAELVTPLAEALQAVIWHCLVSHPALAVQRAKWESVSGGSR